MKKRFVVLIVDGLGVGEMPDVKLTRPQDLNSHTLKHILEYDHDKSSLFYTSGIWKYFCENEYLPQQYSGWSLLLGKSALAHFGADSYLGHQEIVGSKTAIPIRQFVRKLYPQLINKLNLAGYSARFNGKYILVNNAIAVADNLETDYGLNINVVGSLDIHSFSEILSVGKIIRNLVKVNRVIVMGGNNLNSQSYRNCFEIKSRDEFTAWGINIPRLKIYNDTYQVNHLGLNINLDSQVTQILGNNNIPLTLIGKAADIIRAKGATYKPMVHTEVILNEIQKTIINQPYGCIIANIQETDLAGHEQNTVKYLYHLKLIEAAILKILANLNHQDILLICGDHGNDSTIGHTNHTREFTPLIIFSRQHSPQNIGIKSTLSDIGATIAQYFNVPQTTSGTPILRWFYSSNANEKLIH
jgi:phosphopentomutase